MSIATQIVPPWLSVGIQRSWCVTGNDIINHEHNYVSIATQIVPPWLSVGIQRSWCVTGNDIIDHEHM